MHSFLVLLRSFFFSFLFLFLFLSIAPAPRLPRVRLIALNRRRRIKRVCRRAVALGKPLAIHKFTTATIELEKHQRAKDCEASFFLSLRFSRSLSLDSICLPPVFPRPLSVAHASAASPITIDMYSSCHWHRRFILRLAPMRPSRPVWRGRPLIRSVRLRHMFPYNGYH